MWLGLGPGTAWAEFSQERAAATYPPPIYPPSCPHNPAKNSQEHPSGMMKHMAIYSWGKVSPLKAVSFIPLLYPQCLD